MNTLRFVVLATCALAMGCDLAARSGWGAQQVSWSHFSIDQPTIAGIDEACVMFGTYGDSAAVTLWSDGAGGSFGAGWDRPREAVHYSGSLKSHGAQTIDVNAYTADGRAGDVTIAGQKFDLADGSLFLIRSADGETKVKQSTLKIPQPARTSRKQKESHSDTLREFAKSNDEIREFFEVER